MTWRSVFLLAPKGAWHRAAAAASSTIFSLPVSVPPSLQSTFAAGKPPASHGLASSFHRLDTLVVGGPRDLNVTVTVRNEGEDSYRTQVTFFYPSGLSYRRVSSSQVAKPFSGSV